MPRPGPVPMSGPKEDANKLSGLLMAGSSTLSDRGPAMSKANGLTNQAISRRMEKTFPCRSGGTFACQMAWLEPLMIGMKNIPRKAEITQKGMLRLNPIRTVPSKTGDKPAKEHPMHTAFGTAPGTHHQTADHPANCARRSLRWRAPSHYWRYWPGSWLPGHPSGYPRKNCRRGTRSAGQAREAGTKYNESRTRLL